MQKSRVTAWVAFWQQQQLKVVAVITGTYVISLGSDFELELQEKLRQLGSLYIGQSWRVTWDELKEHRQFSELVCWSFEVNIRLIYKKIAKKNTYLMVYKIYAVRCQKTEYLFYVQYIHIACFYDCL